MDDSRQNSILHEFEGIPDIDFSSPRGLPGSPAPEHGWTSYGWLLLERRKLIFKVVIRSLLVSTVVAFLIPSKFESTTRIMPPESSDGGALLALLASRGTGGSSTSGSSGLGALAGNLLGMKTTGALFVELLRSRTVEDSIVTKFNLRKVYGERYQEDAQKILNKRTTIEEDRKSVVISISVADSNRERSRDLAQAYLTALDTLLSQVSTSSARRERIFIEQRMASVKTDLEDAEHQFSAFASKNTALDIKEQGKAMVEAAAVLQGQLMAAQSELQGLEQIYTGNNVRVRSLKARVEGLQNQLQKFGGSDAPLAPDGETESNGTYPTIRELPLLGVQWADLYRRMRIQETVYELLNQQYELTRIQEAKEIPTVRVVDPPDIPEKKSWPPRLLIIAALTSLCFVGAVL
ncbi:MAG: GumC family protein, partial [Terriglobales bacterium]